MNSMPSRLIAVDWSGARSVAEQRRRIVAADWNAGAITLTAGRTREETTEWLIEQSRRTPATVVGLDFSFSFPAWFVEECGAATIEQFWKMATVNAEEWLLGCAGPFWGRPAKKCPGGHRGPVWRGYRKCERHATFGGLPKSTFQIGGAGAVGTGSLRGMQTLLALRRNGFSIWPFHEPRLPCALEIYPRAFTGAVRKSDAATRALYLKERLSAWASAEVLRVAGASEDAFDALCSVAGMVRQREQFMRLERAVDAMGLLEGKIFPGRAITGR
jgi:hypothetical protein